MTKRNPLANNIGSISSGTMRPEDLIPTFLAELDRQRPKPWAHRRLVYDISRQLEAVDRDEYPSYFDSEQAQDDLDELFQALNSYCLPYFYFGAHPGDGADYGFWLSEDFQNEFDGIIQSSNGFTTRTCQGETVLDGIPKGYSGEVLSINDHGNMTLLAYSRGKSRVIWSVV